MKLNSRLSIAVLNSGLSAKDYLLNYGGYTDTDKDLGDAVNQLNTLMVQSKNDLLARACGQAKEYHWAKRAVDGNMDAESFLLSFSFVNAQTPKWQVDLMTNVLAEMIKAEQEARKAAKARENDVMETTHTAAA